MIEIRKVTTGKEQKKFVDFPLELYKGNRCFIPPLYADELKLFKEKSDEYKAEFFLAYKDKRVVGRIQYIRHDACNKYRNENRARFGRFDVINDREVAFALLDRVFEEARQDGVDNVHGPLGVDDLEREGLLIEGFDRECTFEEQYNAPYYRDFLEEYGFTKDVDWYEYRLRLPKKDDTDFEEIRDYILNRYKLHYVSDKDFNKTLKELMPQIFELIDESYGDLYATVPLSDRMQKEIITKFKYFLNKKYGRLVMDSSGELVYLSLLFPSLSQVFVGTKGKLTPLVIFRLLKACIFVKNIDLCLVGVTSEYRDKGIGALMVCDLMDFMKANRIEAIETNLCLEDNVYIRNCWSRFDYENHKKRRAYVKKVD